MPVFPIILILFIGIPIVEIYLFIQIGGLIGAIPTILCIIATAFIGAVLLRVQGIQTMRTFQARVQNGEVPTDTMLEGVCLLVGGLLLLTPGFFTDAIGFLCLIPLTRHFLLQGVARRISATVSADRPGNHSGPSSNGQVIEGEVVDRTTDRHG